MSVRRLLSTVLLILIGVTALAQEQTPSAPPSQKIPAKIPGVDFMKPGPTPPPSPTPSPAAVPRTRHGRKRPMDSSADPSNPNVGAGAYGGNQYGVNPYGKVQVGF